MPTCARLTRRETTSCPHRGAEREGNHQPFPHATTHPKEAAGVVCSCKSLTAPFQQPSDISKAHQFSRCSDAQAIAKQFRGWREAHPVVLESSGLLRQGECGGSSSGGEKLRKQQTGSAEPAGNAQSCQQVPHSGGRE